MNARHAGPHKRAYTAVVLVAVALLVAGLGVWAGDLDGTAVKGDDARSAGRDLPRNAASGELPAGSCAPDEKLVARCGAWWGAYIPYDRNSSLTKPVYAFEKKIGRKLDLVYTYHDMSGGKADGQLLTADEQELGRDRLLMLAWESTVWKEPHHANYTETQLGWKNIASGKYDAGIIDPQVRRLKAYGKRVFFSFDQEVDARIKEGAGTPAEYVAAYRHLHDRFRKLGAGNVVWVWTVSGYLGSADVMKQLYPGDDYVDWIGMDQYNYFGCHDTTDWNDFDETQRPTYDWLLANISAKKPLMLAEFATAPDPADPDRQRGWYSAIPEVIGTMPKVKAMVHWNRATSAEAKCDLTVNEGPALEGYRKAGADRYFKQPVPTR
ncbi:glycoside hydrolase family 26 protein [Streptomyces sp. NPDC005279]|uniref:glycoside hydrolase family 26 protein n=1 Tax=Streptomyces sp. NPDC005279 TaxID=3364712 RepID=UPI0036CB2902